MHDPNLARTKGSRAQQYRGALIRLLKANDAVQLALCDDPSMPGEYGRNAIIQLRDAQRMQDEAEKHARIILSESKK